MRVAKIIAIVAAALFIALLIALSRYGLFASVDISEKVTGPYLLVYKKHVGDYNNVGPIIHEIHNDLKINYSIETARGFGLYYDDPRQVDSAKLRSVVGCIVEGSSIEDLYKVSKKYGVKEYPSSTSVVAEFPYKGVASILMGVLRVYPKLGAYLDEHKYKQTPVMEFYDQPNEKIVYVSSFGLPNHVFDEFLKSKE